MCFCIVNGLDGYVTHLPEALRVLICLNTTDASLLTRRQLLINILHDGRLRRTATGVLLLHMTYTVSILHFLSVRRSNAGDTCRVCLYLVGCYWRRCASQCDYGVCARNVSIAVANIAVDTAHVESSACIRSTPPTDL